MHKALLSPRPAHAPARGRWLLPALLAFCLHPGAVFAEEGDDRLRAQMVTEIAAMAGAGSAVPIASRVLAVMNKVPRHEFVPPGQKPFAYENRPLPIGDGQTISQPDLVAAMTELMNRKPGDNVLEIGTGSGYQAAVLAELAPSVYTIEVVEPLAQQATERLTKLGYPGVRIRAGDGYFGWPEAGPFDAIMVTAAAGHVPPPLLRQLKPGGRMVIPVGAAFTTQQLLLIEKNSDGTVKTRQMMPVRFVPLTGRH